MTKHITTALAVLALLVGVVNYAEPAQVQKETVVQTLSQEQVEAVVGAIPGTTVPGSDFSIGGIKGTWKRQGLNTATNTVCSIKSPGATSTLLYANVRFLTSTTTASKVQFANNSTYSGTSTNVLSTGLYSIGANESVLIQASTTPGTATVFSPNTYLTIGMYGTTNSTVSPTGACEAVFLQ
jgi:hypothetical protein